MTSLYERFINNKFYIYQKEKCNNKDGNISANSQYQYFLKNILKVHQELALQVLFSEKQDDLLLLQNQQLKLEEDIEKELPKIGIVQLTVNKLNFIHHTFAEYFTADFLATQLIENWQDQKVQEFFLTDILIEPNYQVIRAFLNNQLKENKL